MSITYPLLFNEDIRADNLGHEYDLIADFEKNRGLMTQPIMGRNYPIPKSTTINLSGVDNQHLIYENLYNSPDTYQRENYLQAIQEIVRSTNRRRTMADDLIFNELNQLDPRLDKAIEAEEAKYSNMYGKLTDDFVDQVQEGNESAIREKYLYYTKARGKFPSLTGILEQQGEKPEGEIKEGVVEKGKEFISKNKKDIADFIIIGLKRLDPGFGRFADNIYQAVNRGRLTARDLYSIYDYISSGGLDIGGFIDRI